MAEPKGKQTTATNCQTMKQVRAMLLSELDAYREGAITAARAQIVADYARLIIDSVKISQGIRRDDPNVSPEALLTSDI